MSGCMEYCSRFWGSGEGCFGVVWRESDGSCWMRNSTTSRLSNNKTIYTKTLEDEDGIHSALVDLNQMKPLDTDCPAPDKSRHNLEGVDGISYTVQCNKDIGGAYDTHWSYEYHDNPFQAYYHASSLDDCVQKCVGEHPLCRGVVYVPGLQGGYANCWPKTGYPSPLLAVNPQLKVTHSALIDSITTPDTECNKNDTYTSTKDDSKNFAVHCGQTNQGTNMTMVHTQNFTSCMETCAGNKQGCVGVVYDSTLQGGYNNCYLQNTSSVFNDVGSSMYAVLTGAKPKQSDSGSGSGSGSGSNNNGNNNNDKDKDSGSKAWIAGAVIGPILGLALIGAAIFFFRRSKARGAPAAGVSEADDGAIKHNPYVNSSGSGGPAPAYAPVPQYSPHAAPSELGGGDHQMVEMEGQSAAKYAHKGGLSGAGGQPGQTVHEMG